MSEPLTIFLEFSGKLRWKKMVEVVVRSGYRWESEGV